MGDTEIAPTVDAIRAYIITEAKKILNLFDIFISNIV